MSALIQLNGLPCTHCHLVLPRVGAWHAEVVLEQVEAFSEQKATLTFGPSLALTGVVRRSDSADGAGVLTLIGGAGNLWMDAKPQAYRLAPLRLPFGDLLAQAQETLAASAQPEVLGMQLPYWVTQGRPIAQALALLMAEAEATWRVLPDGTVWTGVESWPDTPSFDFIMTAQLPLLDAVDLHTTSPAILPGQSFQGRHVSAVEHTLRGDDVRTRAYFEASA